MNPHSTNAQCAPLKSLSVVERVNIESGTQNNVNEVRIDVLSLYFNGYVPGAASGFSLPPTLSTMFSISCCSIHTLADPCVVSSRTGQIK